MDDEIADEIVARHWHNLVNSIRAGSVDGHLEEVIAAERRRDHPREPVLDTITERMTLLQKNSDSDSDTNGVEDS